MKLSVITPTYNEAKNIDRFVDEVSRALEGLDYEVIVADDDSPDLTWQRVQEIGAKNPRIKVLRRTTNRGLSAAVIDGFSSATGDVVVCMDADLQHDPTALPKMFAKIQQGSDMVIGSRYVTGGSVGEWGPLRRLTSWSATKMAQILLNAKLTDPMSGFFMMRREDFLHIRENLNVSGFKILLEIVAKLKPKALAEVPIVFRTRVAGESKLSGRVIFQYLQQLWRLSFLGRWMPERFIKFAIVGGIGVVVNLLGLVLVIRLLGIRDWRASSLATGIAIINNYALNNIWTYRDRIRRGHRFVKGFVHYLGYSLIALAVTTVVFSALTAGWTAWFHPKLVSKEPSLEVVLVCQFLAILSGTYLNFSLNNSFTWKNEFKIASVSPKQSIRP
jgi:dolichol-phosphate mannosyltransferase